MSLDEQASADVATLTANVVAAYVTKNALRSSELPAMITSVYGALQALGSPQEPEPEKLRPIVSIKKSVTPDYLISLEDGRHFKSLKRHLSGRGLTPEQYREKWSLPNDYPMVAPNYSKQRSDFARTLGLGQLRKSAQAAKAAPTPESGVASVSGETAPSVKRGGRKRKTAA